MGPPGMNATARQRLRSMLTRPDQGLDLVEANLLVAKEQYPDLDIPSYLNQIDLMAKELELYLSRARTDIETLLLFNQYLFEEQGFCGNTDDYYDPRNSYLNDVLDRKTGIPITLSVLYMELARRVGLDASGISFPGHFLVKLECDHGLIVLDPFHGGYSLSASELENRLVEEVGEGASTQLLNQFLNGTDNRSILSRMLRNLKSVYLMRSDTEKALTVVDLLCMIEPDDSTELRDRGMLYVHLNCQSSALNDFREYLRRNPEADDFDAIRDRVLEMQSSAPTLQ